MNTAYSIPEGLPILSAGAHSSPKDGACLLEYASFLAGEEWSDHPACTHPLLASVARRVNDSLGDQARQSLLPLLPRLMGTAETGTNADRHRLRVGLAVWCAEWVAHLAGETEPEALAAIRVTHAWLDGDTTGNDARTAGRLAHSAAYAAAGRDTAASLAAHAAGNAALSAHAAANAAAFDSFDADDAVYAASAEAYAAAAHDAVNAADAKVAFLTGLIDEYDRLTGRTQPAPLAPNDLRNLAHATGA